MKFFKQSLLFKELKKYLDDDAIKYISFDIFDTLLLRYVNDPKDVFDLVGKDSFVQALFGHSSNFRQLRMAAEKKAREVCTCGEICIEDIYKTFTYLSKAQQKKLINLELKKEKETIFINKEIEYWIDLVIQRGKKVIFLSDMYLSKKQILKIGLNKLKYINSISNIFISSELKYTKQQGGLYTYLFDSFKIKPSEIVHIGDNLYTDIAMANINKIKTIHYNCNLICKSQLKHENDYMHLNSSYQIIRHLSSLNNPFADDKKKFFFNFGATIAGPVFWAFSHWLLSIVKQNDIKQINFILREGGSFSQWFKYIFKEEKFLKNIRTNRIKVSRRALFLPSLNEKDLDFHKIDLSLFRELTVEQLFERYGLSVPKSLEQHKTMLMLDLENSTLNEVIEYLEQNKSKILTIHQIEYKKFISYWDSLNIKKRSILFDFGANASMQSRIANLVGNKFINVLFYRTKKGFSNSVNQKQFTFIDYSFENSRKIELLRRSPDIFEILFNGVLGTTLGYEQKSGKVCAIIDKQPLFDDTTIIKTFNKGIKSYIKTAKMYPNIPDIWQPYEILNLMTRVIEFPTIDEVNYLGNLPLNSTDDATIVKPLVNNSAIEFVQQQGVQEVYKSYKQDAWSYWSHLPWIEGTLMKLNKNFMYEQYITSEDKNKKFLKQLLEQIDSVNITSTSIYGTGEFFMLLYSELIIRGITINYLIETIPKQLNYMGFTVLSPQEALKKNQNTFIIASAAFSKVMKETLEKNASKYNKCIKYIVSV